MSAAPAPPYALVRPRRTLDDAIVTFIERQPVDIDLARRQWRHYVVALESAGWSTVEVDLDDTLPDSVFVEDTVVIFGDLASSPTPRDRRATPRQWRQCGRTDRTAQVGPVVSRATSPIRRRSAVRAALRSR